jgi:hypothetical protein
MGVLRVRDPADLTGATWLPIGTALPGPTGASGATGPTGPTGPQGIATVIVGEFVTRDSADLPVDGNIPADWDGVGTFPGGKQMLVGEALINNNTTSATYGDLWQWVGVADPAGWINVGKVVGPGGPSGMDGVTGPTGATGPPDDEVHVGPDTPPLVTHELWFDTDDTRILGPTDLPLGGVKGNALVKASTLDGDYVLTGGGSQGIIIGDDAGYLMAGGGGIKKFSGGAWDLVKHNNNANIRVRNNDGTNATDLIVANGTAQMSAPLKWNNAEGDKIYLYPGATPGSTSFGLGISASAMALFVPDNAVFRFRDGGGHDGGSEYMTLTHNLMDVNVAMQAESISNTSISSTSFHVISGSNGTNNSHYYVDCATNDGSYYFNVLEARRADLKSVFQLKGWQGPIASGQTQPDCHAKMYVNLGMEGIDEVCQWADYGDGQVCVYSHGPMSSTHFQDRNLRNAVDGTSVPIDPEMVGRLIDAVKPITFARHFRSPTASDANEPGFVRPDHDPIPTVGLDFDGVNGDCADLTDRIGEGPSGGYSLGGMLAVAVAEIKSLRQRVAQLEGA